MLNKLLKYDFFSMIKKLIPIYIITIIAAVLQRIAYLFIDKSIIFLVTWNTLLFVSIILIIATIFYTFFISISRFYTNVLRDEGYLTHTLPVKKRDIILSKIISSIITLFISIVVILLAAFIFLYGTEIIKPITDVLFASKADMTSLIWLLGVMLLSYITYVSSFYLALILGHAKSQNKIVASVKWGLIIYILLQIASLIGLGISLLIDNNLLNMANQNVPLSDVLSIIITILVVQIIVSIVENTISIKVLNKSLNLE